MNKKIEMLSENLHDIFMELLMVAHMRAKEAEVEEEDPFVKAAELISAATELVDGEVKHSSTFLLLKANGEYSRIELPIGEDAHVFNERVHELIGCELYEVVSIRDNFFFLVDERGKLGADPKPINKKASLFYPGLLVGDPIVGDVLIGKRGYVNGESDIVGLDEEALSHFEGIFCR